MFGICNLAIIPLRAEASDKAKLFLKFYLENILKFWNN